VLNSCDYTFFFVLDYDLVRFLVIAHAFFLNKLMATSDRFLCNIVLKSVSSKSHVGLLIYEKFLRSKRNPETGRYLQECYSLLDLPFENSSL